MPLAFDASTGGQVSPGTSLTYSHTCTGSDRILIVAVGVNTETDVVTGVTYNTVAMTRDVYQTNAGGSIGAYLYRLVNPATGANDIVVSTNTSVNIRSASASYTGAKQSGQPDATASNETDAADSTTLSITSIADNCWAVSAETNDQSNPANGTNWTERSANAGGVCGIGDSNAVITPAGALSQTINREGAGPAGWVQVSLTIAPIPAVVEEDNFSYII